MMNAECFSRSSLALLVPTRMAVSLVLAVAITSGVALGTQAADKRSGHNLVQACETELPAPTSWCAAYLMGVADTLTAFGKGGHKGGLCGASYSIEDLGEIFLTWMRDHPQFLKLDMLAGASLALRERWPCR